MSVFVTKITGLVVGATAVTGGSYWMYQNSLPKDLKGTLEREGYSLASSTEAFKALFFDNKLSISEISSDGLTSADSLDVAAPKLKKWCEDQYQRLISGIDKLEETKKQVLKFCEDKALTVRARLIRAGKDEFAKEAQDDDYAVVFSLYKSETQFLDLLKKQDTSITKESKNDQGKTALKGWCDKNFALDPKKDKEIPYQQISWYCTSPGYKTVSQKLEKESWKKAEDSEWEDLFDTWKNTTEVMESVKKHDSSQSELGPNTEKGTGGPKLKAWCEAGLAKNLYDDGVYPQEYKLIKSACAKKNIGK